MTKKRWETVLEPFAIVIAGIVESIKAMDDQDLLELRTACDQPTSTNCWCWTYSASQVIRGDVDSEIRQRHLTPNAPLEGRD